MFLLDGEINLDGKRGGLFMWELVRRTVRERARVR